MTVATLGNICLLCFRMDCFYPVSCHGRVFLGHSPSDAWPSCPSPYLLSAALQTIQPCRDFIPPLIRPCPAKRPVGLMHVYFYHGLQEFLFEAFVSTKKAACRADHEMSEERRPAPGAGRNRAPRSVGDRLAGRTKTIQKGEKFALVTSFWYSRKTRCAARIGGTLSSRQCMACSQHGPCCHARTALRCAHKQQPAPVSSPVL